MNKVHCRSEWIEELSAHLGLEDEPKVEVSRARYLRVNLDFSGQTHCGKPYNPSASPRNFRITSSLFAGEGRWVGGVGGYVYYVLVFN